MAVPTTEDFIISGDVYVSSIYVANFAASATVVTIKDGNGNTFYRRSLATDSYDQIHFLEPARFAGGIKAVASQPGAIIIVVGYQ